VVVLRETSFLTGVDLFSRQPPTVDGSAGCLRALPDLAASRCQRVTRSRHPATDLPPHRTVDSFMVRYSSALAELRFNHKPLHSFLMLP
jgi:hypothetical protein